jgi:tetratricopeptide (TPR) repeat protein
MRTAIALCVSMLLVFSSFSLCIAADDSTPDAATLKLLSIAETQHEIIQLLIQKEQYTKAMEEYRGILGLNLPVRYEEAVFKEIAIVTRKFYERGQKDLAYQSLAMGFDALQTPELRARVLNIKASLLKKDGRIDEAIEVYRQEVELREKGDSK